MLGPTTVVPFVVRSYNGSPVCEVAQNHCLVVSDSEVSTVFVLLASVKWTRTTVLRRLALRPEPFFEASDFEIRASVLRRLTVRSEPGLVEVSDGHLARVYARFCFASNQLPKMHFSWKPLSICDSAHWAGTGV